METRTNPTIAISLLVVLSFLLSCEQSERLTIADVGVDSLREQVKRVAEPINSESELHSRLAESIQMQDGLVLIQDSLVPFRSFVLPTNAPWVIQCGIGLSITFGTSLADEIKSNGVQVQLYAGIVSQDDCARLGPATGKQIQAILAGTRPVNLAPVGIRR